MATADVRVMAPPAATTAGALPRLGTAGGRVGVETAAGGGVVLRVRAKGPPARLLWHVTVLALVGAFLLTAGVAVVMASVAWVHEDFHFSNALVRLRDQSIGPAHVVLTVGALAMLGVLLVLAAATLVVQAVLTRRVELEVTPDGWVVRRHGGHELWRVPTRDVTAVEYRRAAVVLCVARSAGDDRRVRGWDPDMAWLAASLRWAVASVEAARARSRNDANDPRR